MARGKKKETIHPQVEAFVLPLRTARVVALVRELHPRDPVFYGLIFATICKLLEMAFKHNKVGRVRGSVKDLCEFTGATEAQVSNVLGKLIDVGVLTPNRAELPKIDCEWEDYEWYCARPMASVRMLATPAGLTGDHMGLGFGDDDDTGFMPDDPEYVLDVSYNGREDLAKWERQMGRRIQAGQMLYAQNALIRLHTYFKRSVRQIQSMVDYVTMSEEGRKYFGESRGPYTWLKKSPEGEFRWEVIQRFAEEWERRGRKDTDDRSRREEEGVEGIDSILAEMHKGRGDL